MTKPHSIKVKLYKRQREALAQYEQTLKRQTSERKNCTRERGPGIMAQVFLDYRNEIEVFYLNPQRGGLMRKLLPTIWGKQ